MSKADSRSLAEEIGLHDGDSSESGLDDAKSLLATRSRESRESARKKRSIEETKSKLSTSSSSHSKANILGTLRITISDKEELKVDLRDMKKSSEESSLRACSVTPPNTQDASPRKPTDLDVTNNAIELQSPGYKCKPPKDTLAEAPLPSKQVYQSPFFAEQKKKSDPLNE